MDNIVFNFKKMTLFRLTGVILAIIIIIGVFPQYAAFEEEGESLSFSLIAAFPIGGIIMILAALAIIAGVAFGKKIVSVIGAGVALVADIVIPFFLRSISFYNKITGMDEFDGLISALGGDDEDYKREMSEWIKEMFTYKAGFYLILIASILALAAFVIDIIRSDKGLEQKMIKQAAQAKTIAGNFAENILENTMNEHEEGSVFSEASLFKHSKGPWECPECGKENEVNAIFCVFCGHSRPEPRICYQCGEFLDDHMEFCPKCGTKYDAEKVAEMREKTRDGIKDNEEPEEKAAGIIEESEIKKEVLIEEEISEREESSVKETVKEEPQKKGNRNRLIIIVVAVAVLVAAAIATFMILGSDKDGNTSVSNNEQSGSATGNVILKSTAVHADSSDGGYEVAVILQVGNRSKDSLTNVTVKTGDGQSFDAYGYVPAGEEGLMAGLLSSDQKPAEDATYQIETTDDSFVSSTTEYHQMTADIIDGGTNVTMETAHGANGYATDWNDDDFAEYTIEINNDNDKSFGNGETIGVAVVYDGKVLKDGDIFYNALGEINAGRTIREKAVLPKTLANDKNVNLVILPKSEVN